MRTLATALALVLLGVLVRPATAAEGPAFNLGVNNPGPGAPQLPGPAQPPGQIVPVNGVPVLSSLSPLTVSLGVAGFTLTLSGNNFSGSSVVNFGGYRASPSSVSATSIAAFIPASALVTGTTAVSVSNPAPGGGASGALSFRVTAAANPTPVVTTIVPATVHAGSGAVTVTVTGTGFGSYTSASLGGVTGAITGGSLAFNLPASLTANAGSLSGLVTNAAPGGGGASFQLNVLNGAPAVSGFAPSSVFAGSAAVPVTVNGSNFVNGSTITFDGTPIPTTFVSGTSLHGTLTAAFLQVSGTVAVGVANPAPGGGTATGGTFAVMSARPTLRSVSPSSVLAGNSSATVVLTGTGFAKNTTATFGGVNVALIFNSPTSITATIPAALLQRTGPIAVVVANPKPGGGTSEAIALPVR